MAEAAEVLLLLGLLAAPWPYGCAGDVARYGLTAVVLLAGSVWALSLARTGEGVPRLALPAGGLVALGVLQIAFGSSAAPVWTAEAVLVLSGMLTAFVFWSERARDRGAARRLATTILAVCAAEAAFGAVQWSMGPDTIYGRTAPIVTTPFGSFVNHNHFAGLVEMGALLAAGMALGHARRAGEPTPASLGLGGLSLGLVCVHLASRSRGGLLALAGGFAVLAIGWASGGGRSRRHAPVLALAALAALGFGLAVVPGATRAHLATLLRGPADTSGEYRVDMAGATLRLALAHPVLGSGLGAYADAVTPLKRGHGDVRVTHAESDVLELAAEGGLAGLALALALAAAVVAGLRGRLREGHDPFRKGIALGAAAAAAALLVHSLVDFNLRIPSNALAFAVLAGLAAAPRSAPRRIGATGLAAALGIVLAALSAAAAWRAEGALALEAALGREDPQRRIQALDGAIARHPLLAEALRARALASRDLATSRAFASARLERAGADLGRALRLRPQWAEAWADLGGVRFLQGDAAGARSALDRAVALDPTHLQLSRIRADLLARTGRRGQPSIK